MTALDLPGKAADFVLSSQENAVSAKDALTPGCDGLRLFEAPLFAFGEAADPLFERLREPEAAGGLFRRPAEWLPGAKTVVSFFLPFCEPVRRSNRAERELPSPEWLHGRIEGQVLLDKLCDFLAGEIAAAGGACVAPSLDGRFRQEVTWRDGQKIYATSWSERHVAFVCGMGTFGLSRGIITEKGMAGRLGSLVTTLELPSTPRKYTGIYEYCVMCGKCVKNCPADAITLERGKEHAPCSEVVDHTKELFAPRYGCGKCQVAVPCEAKIPKRPV